MATLDPESIRGAIVENLEGAVTGVRQIDVGEASADLHPGADDETKIIRAAVMPRFTVIISDIRASEGSPMGPGSLRLYDIAITIRCFYNLHGPGVDHVDYNDRKAVAEKQVDMFAQRLSWPGAITSCQSTGRSTGIVSGVLTPKDALYRITRDEPDKSIFEVEQTYAAVVRVDAAIA